MSIVKLMNDIKDDGIVLPAIQRDFVWSEEKIKKLFDSIMRGYPIGIILLWETHNDIQFRSFVKDYQPDVLFTFRDNPRKKRLKLVLDGQQRLQSLYMSLFGTNEGKYLYFDILSGRETEDFKEDKFSFDFFTSHEVVERNKIAILESKEPMEKNANEFEPYYYSKVQDLINIGAREKQEFIKDIIEKLKLSDEDELRLKLNLDILRDVLFSEGNILKETVLDQDKPPNSADRKKESDILEAFVRINREGTPLSRSDLIFSMLKLNWRESAETLPEFVKKINEGNSFELDADFVIRCLFAVSDLGTKFDINILRKPLNIQKIQANFEKCCNAICSCVDYVKTECWTESSKLLGGYYNLVPFVYYLFHMKNHQVPNSEMDRVRKSVYLFGFTRPFSRYADSRIGKFVREELKPRIEKNEMVFPLEDAFRWVRYWENIEEYGPKLLQGNPELACHLVQRRSGGRVHYEKNAPQIDHIFPRSKLREMKRFSEEEINHFANFWILAKNKNQNKGNKHPKEYFKDVLDSVLKRAYIDKDLLNYNRYRTFLQEREAKILNHAEKELKIQPADFPPKEEDSENN